MEGGSSGPYSLLVSRDRSAFWIILKKIKGRGNGLVRGAAGDEGVMKLSRLELEE